MAEKTVIVLCGVSGVGKTYARTHHHKLKHLPAVDVADVYLDNPGATWIEASAVVIKRTLALLKEHDRVVVEGYYLPGTVTRGMLAEGLGRYAAIDWRLMVVPISVCRQRVEGSEVRVDLRLDILERVWERSGKMLVDLAAKGYTWQSGLDRQY